MKQLFESIINGEWHENKELQNIAKKVKKSDEAPQMTRKFEQIIRCKNKNI